MNLCAAYKVFNGGLYLAYSMKSIYNYVDQIVIFVSTKPWNGPLVPLDDTVEIIRKFPDPMRKIRFVVQDFRYDEDAGSGHANELREMNALLNYVRKEFPSTTHYLYIDADEVWQPDHMRKLRRLLSAPTVVGEVHVAWRCYWKSFKYWIDPFEPSRPTIAFRVTPDTKFVTIRDTNMEPKHFVSPDNFFLHHFSYALTSDMVAKKIKAWSHCKEIASSWYEKVWLAWDANRTMENLHPVNPPEYKRAAPADESQLPEVMKGHPFFGKDIV
jgi:hypothetical protein